jgi:hypothetical protein
MKSDPPRRGGLYQRAADWLGRVPGRPIVLLLAAFLSLPSIFSPKPSLGLDSAWQHSLQVAVTGNHVFGRDLLFTYGPLGYLLTRSPVHKLHLLLYDLFVLGSLWSIYRRLLPIPMAPARAVLVLALAIITKEGLQVGSVGILFIIAGYWFWRLYADDSAFLPLTCSLAASGLLFFGKANFGLMMLGLIPCYCGGLLLFRQDWGRAVWLAGGFALVLLIGSILWRVDLRGYLRASLELAGGYNEAMFLPLPARSPVFLAGGLFTLGVMVAALAALRTSAWRDWMMISPFVMVTAWLLFKNAFVRADAVHLPMFLASLPLVLAVWSLALPLVRCLNLLLVLSVLGGVVQLELVGYSLEWFSWTPFRYARGVWVSPRRQNGEQLGAALRAQWPELQLPANVRSLIGRSSVDVMPWDSSLAILNGLNLKERPVMQSYAAYTPWLDAQNARFLGSDQAADIILYVTQSATNGNATDNRPAAWDESMAKRPLMENYTPRLDFQMTERLFPTGEFHPEWAVVLERTPAARAYEPIATNDVSLDLGQTLDIPATADYEFLWLEVERSTLGKLSAFASQPAELTAEVQYSDGTTRDYFAILPILKTGVLLNYRIESPDEIRRWLYSETTNNAAARSIRFKSSSPWAFKSPWHGQIITSRLVNRPGQSRLEPAAP